MVQTSKRKRTFSHKSPSATIQEAIQRGIMFGPLNQLEQNLFNELKDFLAHETMRMELDENVGRDQFDGAMILFDRVFKK